MKQLPPLLSGYANLGDSQPTAPLSPAQWMRPAQRHLGSVNNKFPLSPSQRESFYNFLALPQHSVLAVSGPPGTGKTTLLHTVIASLWVEAAVAGAKPPVIVAASTNNQAVTNVIDSLGQIGDVKRWLPVGSFGLYLVNNRQRQDQADQMGTLWVNKRGGGFPEQVETLQFISQARKSYLENCSTFFGREVTAVDDAVDLLHQKLRQTVQQMNNGIQTAYDLTAVIAQQAQSTRQFADIETYIAQLQQQILSEKEKLVKWRKIRTHWLRLQKSEPIWYALLPKSATQQKRRQTNAVFLAEIGAIDKVEPENKVIQGWIGTNLEQSAKRIEELKGKLADIEAIPAKFTLFTDAWNRWTRENEAAHLTIDQLFTLETADGATEQRCLFNWLDTHLRYELFVLATHYWEGRWLQEVDATGIAQSNFRERRDQETQMDRWQRYACLTPCFVTTMHSGSSFFDYYQGQSEQLFDFIDLLIVDEAGQVSPEISGAMFALAKQALVVGDTLQIEPVWSIPEAVDRGNLERYKLIASEEDFFRLQEKGVAASSGSVMRMAQQASPYQLPGARERGMFLAEHRRCVPEIIGYCNDLAYGGRLRSKRPSIANHPWPHMGYVHVKGKSQSAGGSRQNEREATAVTAWIAANKAPLEAHYQTDIDNIIGVITPFAAQKQLLLNKLNDKRINIAKVGTVHALQGAERPVVIFSPVYASQDSGPYFFDRGPNMLNVAVSRAKDSFIVIGDMDIFDPRLNTPSGLLAQYLFAAESNELLDAPLPERPSPQRFTDAERISTLQKHRDVLARAFERAEKRLVIVSPYLRIRAVDADDIGAKVTAARARGVTVLVYVDDGFNDNLQMESAAQAADRLRRSGAEVRVCHNIHSKIICIDDEVFIEGSFNWLSAERVIQEYARYETSTIHQGETAAQFIAETLEDIQARAL
jgi:KaiC/GvpD/RAD55 family RecA-like ATPase